MHTLASIDHLYYVQQHSNPLVRYGKKCFSQSDEDGLTLEIVKRIQPKYKTFLELGVGSGTENNTLILASLGWKGQWIGNQPLAVNFPLYTDAFITKDNVLFLIRVSPSVVSIDLDGNDYHILKSMLTVIEPDLLILEYNSMFPPAVNWVMPYNENHVWDGTNYFGASLQAYVDLLTNYRLIVCNAATGCNAFFVKRTYNSLFSEVPTQIEQIYVPPRYGINLTNNHHSFSTKTLEVFL